jgi:hypothetical protein
MLILLFTMTRAQLDGGAVDSSQLRDESLHIDALLLVALEIPAGRIAEVRK